MAADIRGQLGALGLSGRSLKAGEVYTVPDLDVSFPKTKLQRDQGQGVHETRTVVIMQDGPTLVDPLLQTVLVAPTSCKTNVKTCNDLLLSLGEGGLVRDSVCMVDHIQPVLKTNLITLWGRLANRRIEELQVLLAAITGSP